jgi:hypothetical protein
VPSASQRSNPSPWSIGVSLPRTAATQRLRLRLTELVRASPSSLPRITSTLRKLQSFLSFLSFTIFHLCRYRTDPCNPARLSACHHWRSPHMFARARHAFPTSHRTHTHPTCFARQVKERKRFLLLQRAAHGAAAIRAVSLDFCPLAPPPGSPFQRSKIYQEGQSHPHATQAARQIATPSPSQAAQMPGVAGARHRFVLTLWALGCAGGHLPRPSTRVRCTKVRLVFRWGTRAVTSYDV